MKVIRAEVLGFCMGVRRAVELACGAVAEAAASAQVYTFGPLIHNPQALADMRGKGVETLNEHTIPENLRGAVVIIRAHGLSPHTETELRKRGARIIDATCPRVKASQLKAAALAKAGFRLFLAGEEHHAEIAGVKAYVEAAGAASVFAVVGNAAEAEQAAARLCREDTAAKTALIGQTTISADEYREIGKAISCFFPGLEIVETICPATTERQDSLRKLLGQVEAVIIAGGKGSANTRRLLAIAEAAGKPCALVETAADIPAEFFQFASVGLAAGASTPDFVIDAIEEALHTLQTAA